MGGVSFSLALALFAVGATGGSQRPQRSPSPIQTLVPSIWRSPSQPASPQAACLPAANPALAQNPSKTEPTAVEVERYLRRRGMGSFHLDPEIMAWRSAVSRVMRQPKQSMSAADLHVAPCLVGIKERTARYACFKPFNPLHPSQSLPCTYNTAPVLSY